MTRLGLAAGARPRYIAVAGAMVLIAARTSESHTAPLLDTAIVPGQAMDWGLLVGGVSERIDPRDARRRGEIDFVGKGKNTVRLMLPSVLVSSNGARLPLLFRKGDLIVEYTGNGGTSTPDPDLPIDIHPNPGQGDVRFLIGGTAAPTIDQRSGSYTATITAMFVNSTL